MCPPENPIRTYRAKDLVIVQASINLILNEEHTMDSPTVTGSGGRVGVPELFMA